MILDFLFLTITYSAGYLVVCIVTVLSTLSFMLHKHSKRVLPLLLSVLGTGGTVYILKNIFDLSRPETAYYIENSASFPSGHSALAMALYGFLFVTIWQHDRHHLKNKSLFLLALLILGIGFSRIYLGVHYSEDVLAGFAIGLFWLFLSIKLHKHSHTKK